MSYRIARLVLESAEVQVPVEVDQQYNVVTAMDGIDVQPGTMINVIKVTDKQIEFKVVDSELTGTVDYDTFVTHCQLQSNNVNESTTTYDFATMQPMTALKVSKDTETVDHAKKPVKAGKTVWFHHQDQNGVAVHFVKDALSTLHWLSPDVFVADEALSPADTTRLTAIINNTYAMVNYAHVLHNNDFDAPNVNAVHLALETLYQELPALADELGEACRFDYDITLDHTVVINESNPVKACFDLRNDLLSLQKDMPGYINSMIDAINGLLTSVMYKMVRLGGLQKPTIAVVTEAEARGWSEYSAQEKLNALKLAIMSDGLAYDAEDYIGKDLKDMPKELRDALEIVTTVNESEAQDAYREFFRKKLEEYGVTSPAQLDADKKSEFFKAIKAEWPDAKEEMLNESFVNEGPSLIQNTIDFWDQGIIDARKFSLDMIGYDKAKIEKLSKLKWSELDKDTQQKLLKFHIDGMNESASNMVGSKFANYFAKADDKKKSQVADMLDIEKTATPEQITKAFDSATSNDQETCCKILSIDESAESTEANKVAFARAYADCNDIKKVQKIDEILLKAGQRVSTAIDVAFAAVKPEVQKELCKVVGIEWTNESTFINEADSAELQEFKNAAIAYWGPAKATPTKISLLWKAFPDWKDSKIYSHAGKKLDKFRLDDLENFLVTLVRNVGSLQKYKAVVERELVNESVQTPKKRSVIAALKYVNEELEVGAELKCLKDLVTTDGTVIPAESTVSYTGIDSNTNVATVTFGENSYAVTIPDLTAATQQMGPAI